MALVAQVDLRLVLEQVAVGRSVHLVTGRAAVDEDHVVRVEEWLGLLEVALAAGLDEHALGASEGP